VEYLDHNELGLAFETLGLVAGDGEVDQLTLDRLEDPARQMGVRDA
jgi:hypothetical protein